MKLTTPVSTDLSTVRLSLTNRTAVLGSCFSSEIGARLKAAGFDMCINPFGALYNPLSIASAIERLDSGMEFTADDCVPVGAGSQLICSHSHHTSFARENAQEFLDNANSALAEAHAFWKGCDRVIITLGTAFVWTLKQSGMVVSNCLKRPACEFDRRMMDAGCVAQAVGSIIGSHPEKEFIFTVSPIRHMGDGAHGNALSKSTLLLGLDKALSGQDRAAYFPSYEIVLDELRDYRFYADDLVHPSALAVSIIWERFLSSCVPECDYGQIAENEKKFKQLMHRQMR